MKILVVDDDPVVRKLMSDFLSFEGYDVVAKENGRLAWEYLSEKPVDLCFSDVNMPEMDGLELLRRVRGTPALSGLYFILLTIRELSEDKVMGYDSGADEYLTKPFENMVLLSKVKAIERNLKSGR